MQSKIDWDTYEVIEGIDFELGDISMYIEQLREEIDQIAELGKEFSLEMEALLEQLGELESEENNGG